MDAFILFVENEVSTQAAAPTAAQVESTLRLLPVNGNREFKLHAGLPGDAGFVGNARITRVARVGLPGGRVTRVAWLYQWPDPPGATPEQNAQLYADVVRNVLANVQTYMPTEWTINGTTQATGWKPPIAVHYDPATNGSIAWWESPTGSYATTTRDTFNLNQQMGDQSTIDNPIGPTTNRAPDFDPFHTSNPDSTLNKLIDVATTLAWVVGGVAVLYYVVGPLVGVATAGRKNPTNPSARIHRLFESWRAMTPARRRTAIRAHSKDSLIAILSWNDHNGDFYDMDHDEAAELLAEVVEREL